jgi:septal ring factor EnvC (AmiA/AmiB activator)
MNRAIQILKLKNRYTAIRRANMNNSANYAKQIKNAKRGGYTPTIAKDINKHKIQKALRLIEQWRSLAQELKPQMQFDMAFTLEECAQELDRILKNR